MTLLQKYRRLAALILLNFAVLAFFLAHVAGLFHWPFISQMENLAYDTRMLLSMQEKPDNRIVIVDIDEKSLAAEGRWPWSRDKLAVLLDRLFDDYGVSLVGFDVIFAEPDRSSGLGILDSLAQNEFSDIPEFRRQVEEMRPNLDYDNIFAMSMDGRPVVLGLYFNVASEGGRVTTSGALPEPAFSKNDLGGRAITSPLAVGYGANLAELQQHAGGGGHFNPTIDEDGIVRRVPLLYEYDGNYYEALSLVVTRLLLGVERVEPVFVTDVAGNYAGLEWLKIGYNYIPVDDRVQAMVPYRGRQGSFPYVSATDVINATADSAILANAVVLVGTTAPGLFDLRSTPVQSKFPGVEIHANMIAGILDQKIREKPEYVRGVEFLSLLATGLLITLVLPLLTPAWAMGVTFLLLMLTVFFNYYVWEVENIVLPVASSIMLILFMFLLNMSYGFFIERRRKSEITNLFGQYVPPELVEEMSNDPQAYSQEAEEREMTVLFTDVRGFTTLSEGLTPKELSRLMNEFLTSQTSIIHEHRGTIDKYMGDAIMAFWGAPIADPDHARHALEAGLAMIRKMYALHDEFEKRGWPRLNIGVGINTGIMSVGNMGSKFRTAYTAIGDAVNLGSRLEGLTKQYGVDLIVGEETMKKLPDYAFRELDRVRVKGKLEPIAIYEPLSKREAVSEQELNELRIMEEALHYYRAQDWKNAESLFTYLQRTFLKRPVYELYLERLVYFQENPPGEAWDGAFTFTIK